MKRLLSLLLALMLAGSCAYVEEIPALLRFGLCQRGGAQSRRTGESPGGGGGRHRPAQERKAGSADERGKPRFPFRRHGH